MSDLRWGYTTGVHASFAFKSALDIFLATDKMAISTITKMENDDLDITQGCEIVVTVADSEHKLSLNPTPHQPYILDNLTLYAGEGVGVVTKNGLKPPKGYPAINPTPLKAIENIYLKFGKGKVVCSSISVVDGERLAKQTANGKVGVVGGISILGTTGFVKPISAQAYLDSIRTELNFLKQNGFQEAILTLGNSSLNYAKRYYSEMQIVEIGNFIYDSFKIASTLHIPKVRLICGVGKGVKVAQGHKNSHNRFGSIDFFKLQDEVRGEFGIEIDIEETKTVRGIASQIEGFHTFVELKAKEQLERWFPKLDIDIRILK
jgi:cobalt-precorrin-5B (C1)-methyltransferase